MLLNECFSNLPAIYVKIVFMSVGEWWMVVLFLDHYYGLNAIGREPRQYKADLEQANLGPLMRYDAFL